MPAGTGRPAAAEEGAAGSLLRRPCSRWQQLPAGAAGRRRGRPSAGGLAAGGREEVEGQRQGGGPVAGGREEGAGWRSRSRSRVWEAEDGRRDRVGKSLAFLEKRAGSRVSISSVGLIFWRWRPK